MITTDEILSKCSEIASMAKPFMREGKIERNKQGKLPEYYKGYNRFVSDYHAILNHSEKGRFPMSLFKERSPNETDREFEYRKRNYKQKTLPIYQDFHNTIQRAFNDANWKITYTEDNSESVDKIGYKKYVTKKIPIYGSLEGFMRNVLTGLKIKDANGVVGVRPYKYPMKEVETETGVDLRFDDTEVLDPTPFYYSVEQNVCFKDDEYFFILLDKRSMVRYGKTKKPYGLIFEVWDNNAIYTVTQVGKYVDMTFEITMEYIHNLDRVPMWRLMGTEILMDNKLFFQSPFLYAVDCLDLVLLNSSNLQMAMYNTAYPYRIMLGQKCEFIDPDGHECNQGVVENLKDQTSYKCPSCNGTGVKSRLNVMGSMIIDPDETENISVTDAMTFVQPSTENLEFLANQIREDENRARNILHIHLSNSEVHTQPNETATGQAIDQKAMYAFIAPQSDQIFSLYERIGIAIGEMRYGTKFKPFDLNYPKSFDFLTESDYLRMINEAIESGLPPFVVHSIIYKYLSVLFYQEEQAAKAFELITKADRLVTLTNEEINIKLSRRTIEKWEEVLHTSAINFVEDLIMEDPDFLDQEIEVQVEKLQAKAKEKADALPDTQIESPFSRLSQEIGG